MSRFKISLCIFAIVIVFSIGSGCIIRNKTKNLLERLRIIQSLSEEGDASAAAYAADEICIYWQDCYKKLNPLVKTEKLRDINSSIVRLSSLIDEGSDEINAEIESVRRQTEILYQSEEPFIWNIF